MDDVVGFEVWTVRRFKWSGLFTQLADAIGDALDVFGNGLIPLVLAGGDVAPSGRQLTSGCQYLQFPRRLLAQPSLSFVSDITNLFRGRSWRIAYQQLEGKHIDFAELIFLIGL